MSGGAQEAGDQARIGQPTHCSTSEDLGTLQGRWWACARLCGPSGDWQYPSWRPVGLLTLALMSISMCRRLQIDISRLTWQHREEPLYDGAKPRLLSLVPKSNCWLPCSPKLQESPFLLVFPVGKSEHQAYCEGAVLKGIPSLIIAIIVCPY